MAKRLINLGKSGMHVGIDNLPELMLAIKRLGRDEVLVGVPADNTDRDDPLSKEQGITNAAIAYIQDNGAPEQRIPARPFMIPGMEASTERVTALLATTARYTLAGQPAKIDEGYMRVGFEVVKNITGVIRGGIAPALAERTLVERARRGRKGAQTELDRRARGLGPSMRFATPLMDTNEMLKSITFVIRAKSARGK